MTQIILVFLSVTSAFAARPKPKFHCYTTPGTHVSAYQSPVKCAAGDRMEIVCTYAAGCKPAPEGGEPPRLEQDVLNAMVVSNELKSSMLICKGKGEIKDGVITKIECPTATQCRGDGFFGGVSAGENAWIDPVTAPVREGGPRATR